MSAAPMPARSAPTIDRAARLPRALILAAAGAPGILSLLLVLPQMTGIPPAALLLQPALLLGALALAGSWAAPRCGLLLAGGLRPGERAGQAAAGMLIGLAIAVADHASRGFWQTAALAPPSIVEGWSGGRLVVGVLYGGVVEEIVFRWGVMSLCVLGLARGLAAPPRWAMGAGAILAAALFAASHLPMLATWGAALGGSAVVRTLLLNGLPGLAFGLLFARRDLVAAIIAHAAVHVGFAIAVMILSA